MSPPSAPDDTSASAAPPSGLTDLLGDGATPRWYRRRSLWAGVV